jgi:hypothetical protein
VNFSDLKNRHAGATVTICATGPSLDLLDICQLSGPRIVINRAAFALPSSVGESYWLVVDDAFDSRPCPGPWKETLATIQRGDSGLIGVFRDPLLGMHDFPPAPRGEAIIHFKDARKRRDDLLGMDRDQVAALGELYQFTGTGATALHLAWFMGAGTIELYGFDGKDGYAQRLRQFYDAPAKGGIGYGLSREHALKVIRALNLNVIDHATA